MVRGLSAASLSPKLGWKITFWAVSIMENNFATKWIKSTAGKISPPRDNLMIISLLELLTKIFYNKMYQSEAPVHCPNKRLRRTYADV